jgi:5-methylcytosine-specific restriction endonuclease McrA
VTTRCKVGDMAIVVGGSFNVGKIVTVVKRAERTHLTENLQSRHGHIWEVNRQMIFRWAHTNKEELIPVYPDCFLLPLPKLDEEDDLYSENELPQKESA